MGSSCSNCTSLVPESSDAIEGQDWGPSSGEYEKFSSEFHESIAQDRIPGNGSIELIENCNFRCIHCYQGMKKHKEILSAETWFRILDEITDMGTLWLLLTGGEPTLHPEFERIYEYAIKKGLLINLFTNAALLKTSHFDLLKKYPPFALEVTLYGFSEETYQETTGTKGSFAKVVENCHRMVEIGLPLKLKTIVMKPVLKDFWKMKSFAEDILGVPFKFDTRIDPSIYGDDYPDIRLSAEETIALEEANIPKELLKKDYEDISEFRKNASEKTNNTSMLYTCGAGKSSYYIDYQGWIHTCSIGRLWKEKFDLNEYSFKDIWINKLPKITYRKIKTEDSICKQCEYLTYCDACPATAHLATGQHEGRPQYICQITMARKKHLFESQEKEELICR